MKENITTKIRKELQENIDEGTLKISQRFFKEEIKFYGVKSSCVTKIAKKYFFEIKNLPKDEIFSICETLLQSDYNEEAWIAFDWSYNIHKKYEESDINIFQSWIEKYVNNWAKCDTLCNHSVGAYLDQFPHQINTLKKWAHSKNRWMKRASVVSLILPARNGKFLDDIFEISNILLTDQDDMVQKGYGWVLKEASKKHQDTVFNFIQQNKKVMPRTALRYAIEKMPEDLRQKAMQKA